MESTSGLTKGQGNAFLEFFATDEAVSVLEATLQTAAGNDRPWALIALAWQLRQRDTQRALTLAAEAEANIADAGLPDTETQRIAARVMLIRGEAKWLFAELDAGNTLAERALQMFNVLDDTLGRADALWLRGLNALHQGDSARADAEWAAMATTAAIADPVRGTVAQAIQGRHAIFHDVAAAKQRWGAKLSTSSADLHPAAAYAVENFWGGVAHQNSDYVQSIRHFSKTYTLSLATGQIRSAILSAANVGDAFNCLNDHQAALEWMQRGLDLAVSCGWPGSKGTALAQTAETLRRLMRFDAARDLLHEALVLMAPVAASRNYALALRYLGDVELDGKHYSGALETFQLLEKRAVALREGDSLTMALRGQAQALLGMDQPQSALEKAQAALAVEKSNANYQIAALRVIADIHARDPLPPPPGMHAPSAPLHYLQHALDLAATIQDYTVPSELLEAIAREYAKIGDTGQAYQFALQAIQARQKIHTRQADDRASAMQISHETARTRAEGEQHRQLALAHAARAETLQQANATLEQLGAIGREITGNLETAAIFAALDHHVHVLLDAHTFMIYRVETDGKTLKRAFGVEAGRPLAPFQIQHDDPASHTARCAQERRELVIEAEPQHGNVFAGTIETRSAMFAPLMVGARVLGVMTIQSPQPHAYSEREVAILRTLCAYTAIALANGEAQAKLIQSEKMASLGQLVANVAHEINTPIAAVKSSGMSIDYALQNLLESNADFGALDLATRQLFAQLVGHAGNRTEVLSSREERVIVREVTRQLEAAGIVDPRHKADLLVQLGVHSALADYYPLLCHPEAEVILSRAQSTATIINGTANINTAVDRVAKIVFALKSFSRVDSRGEMVLANLTEGLETVLTIYQNQIKRGTELVRQYENLPPLRCLPDELNQVWTNLIHNALQAMNYQGTLTISLRRVDNDAVLTVGDTGCGIPEAIRHRIFDPFFTTKPIGEGSGLGLDIVKKIVDKHRGRIDVHSEVGVGTSFVVSLPFEAVAI